MENYKKVTGFIDLSELEKELNEANSFAGGNGDEFMPVTTDCTINCTIRCTIFPTTVCSYKKCLTIPF